MVECAQCGEGFSARQPGMKFCSSECRSAARHAPRCFVRFKACEFCGGLFTVRNAAMQVKARACRSDVCQAEMKRVANREREREYFAENGVYRTQGSETRAQKDARDARRRIDRFGFAAEVEAFDRTEVFERDAWACALCHEPVDRELVNPHPRAATIDHIQPLSEGGSHTADNAQLAHRICNVLKGADIGDAIAAA